MMRSGLLLPDPLKPCEFSLALFPLPPSLPASSCVFAASTFTLALARSWCPEVTSTRRALGSSETDPSTTPDIEKAHETVSTPAETVDENDPKDDVSEDAVEKDQQQQNRIKWVNYPFVFLALRSILVASRRATLAQRSDTVRFFRCSGAILAPGCILARAR